MNIDDELLAAYLDAELSSSDEAALEERLTAEPDLARRLDRLAEVRVVLQGLDDEELPAGAEARLDARLAAERVADTPAPPATAVPPVDLAAERARRRPSFSGWATAAAAVAAVAVVGGVALQGLSGSGGGAESADMALEDSASSAESAAGGAAESQQYAATSESAGPATATGSELSAPPTAQDSLGSSTRSALEIPLVVRTTATLDDASDVRRRYGSVQAGAKSGASVRQNRSLPPPPCVNAIDTTASIERIERIRFDGVPAVAYVLSSAGDRQAVVLAVDGCNSLALVSLAG